MFGYELLRNKWVILMILGGLAFLVYVVVVFNDYNKPRKRKEDNPEKYATEYLSTWEGIPWSVKAIIAAVAIFAVVYSIHAIIHPNSF